MVARLFPHRARIRFEFPISPEERGCLPRSYLVLKKRYDFRRTYEHGASWANRLLVLYVHRGCSSHRCGFSVSKRVGKAVVRNRVRRRLKEGCQQLLVEATLPGDCIVIARVGASKASYADLVGALSDLFRRAKVLC